LAIIAALKAPRHPKTLTLQVARAAVILEKKAFYREEREGFNKAAKKSKSELGHYAGVLQPRKSALRMVVSTLLSRDAQAVNFGRLNSVVPRQQT
jgi:hypothetical protein